MTANRIIHHIFNEPDLRQVDQASLEQLVEKYPYFAAARMLLARKEFAENKDLTASALKKAQLYSNTPQQVHQFVTAPLHETPVSPVEVDNAPAEAALSAEDEAILAELAAEDARNAAAARATEVVEEEAADVATEQVKEEQVEEPVVIEDAEEVGVNNEITEEEQQQAPAPSYIPDAEDEAIAAKYDEFLYEQETPAEAPDEVVAVDYEAEQEKAEFETARTQAAPDEIVAVDYKAEQEKAEFETARTQAAPDEIVAIDYEAEQEKAEFEAARNLTAPDEIIAIDYSAIREEEHYEPEPEEEEIVVETAASAEGAGLTLPAAAAPVADQQEEPATNEAPEADHQEEPQTEEAPIRIHPMDTPAEETVLTFQPLYTEDYFAYKKLKDPNSAEMMTDKAAAEMRSFTDWLRELKDSFAGRATKDWYHQQLNRLYEDDEPEVSERVEKMAIDSITLNDDIVSETLAEIWVRQHQHGKAIAVYQKLSLLNPDKNAYFAQKIKDLQLLTDNNK
ncbi:hypothetical protein [Chitinophaga sp.]|uniref:hypothetical protein n=1 Tax=Chitinophaga sp. TaxID=1869181 RepID=UPI0031E2C164